VPVLRAFSGAVAPLSIGDSRVEAGNGLEARANTASGGRMEPKLELELEGVVEPALARALVLAAEAGRWAIVEQIARELKERRDASADSRTKAAAGRAARMQVRPGIKSTPLGLFLLLMLDERNATARPCPADRTNP
jgi:hypothetical protein